MGYSVVDFLVSSLFRWIFSEEHPLENAEYSPGAFVRLLMNAAQAKDYVESISGIDQGLPNVDTLFLAIIRVCQQGSDIVRIQKSRERGSDRQRGR
jgi:GTPase SAR1 family protein